MVKYSSSSAHDAVTAPKKRSGPPAPSVVAGTLRVFRSHELPKLKEELYRLHMYWPELFRAVCQELYNVSL